MQQKKKNYQEWDYLITAYMHDSKELTNGYSKEHIHSKSRYTKKILPNTNTNHNKRGTLLMYIALKSKLKWYLKNLISSS